MASSSSTTQGEPLSAKSTAGVTAEQLQQYVDILSTRQRAIDRDGYGQPVGLEDLPEHGPKSAGSGLPRASRVQPTYIVEPSDPYDIAVGLGLTGPRDPDAARASANADGGTTISSLPAPQISTAIRNVLAAQEERVALFRQLDSAIKKFEADSTPAQHLQLQQQLAQLTPAFARVSTRIRDEANQLKQGVQGGASAAAQVDSLQQHEKEKWGLTLQLLQSRIKVAVWAAAPGTAPPPSSGKGGAPPDFSPSQGAQQEELELQSQLRSAITGAIDCINEALDELRMQAADAED